MERWIEEGRRVESGEAELGEWGGNIKRRADGRECVIPAIAEYTKEEN